MSTYAAPPGRHYPTANEELVNVESLRAEIDRLRQTILDFGEMFDMTQPTSAHTVQMSAVTFTGIELDAFNALCAEVERVQAIVDAEGEALNNETN